MYSQHKQLPHVIGIGPRWAMTNVRQKATVVCEVCRSDSNEQPRDLEQNALTDWQPQQLLQHWRDVFTPTGTCDQATQYSSYLARFRPGMLRPRGQIIQPRPHSFWPRPRSRPHRNWSHGLEYLQCKNNNNNNHLMAVCPGQPG